MNNYDDIFDTAVPDEQSFDKDAWAERKQAERQAVYELADATAAEVCADGAKFQAYLDTQARFDRYSVTNVLLIMAQMPTVDSGRVENAGGVFQKEGHLCASEICGCSGGLHCR